MFLRTDILFGANYHNMGNEQVVSIITILKGKSEIDSCMVGIFHCRLTATIQLFFNVAFWQQKYKGSLCSCHPL